MFYSMIPDLDGHQRLQADLAIKAGKDGKKHLDAPLADRWDAIRQEFVDAHNPGKDADDKAKDEFKALEAAADELYAQHVKSAEQYLTDALPEIKTHFDALDRFEAEQAPGKAQNAAFQKQRRWDKMQELRAEAKVWLTELDNREHVYRRALQALVAPNRAVDKDPKDEFQPARWNPFRWTRIEQISFAVTYGLTAIGLCLILGLCTRLAALGGAAFMLFVVLTQPAWPGLFPHDPAVAGHALLINKDFIEMLSLLVVASTTVGRWGGLDYFLHHLVVNPFLSKTVGRDKK
jgi:uncharacterized membrane protein YphA (DoxX/SURF4 family)